MIQSDDKIPSITNDNEKDIKSLENRHRSMKLLLGQSFVVMNFS